MATTQVSGGDFLKSITSNLQNTDSFYLGSYLTWGNLASESWNTQEINDASSNRTLNWKSSQGSVISYKDKNSGSETTGTSTGSLSVAGKLDGLKASASWNNSWTENSQNDKTSYNLTYLGDNSTKADDISYKLSYSSKYSEASGAVNSETANLDFSNADWAYKFSQSLSGNQSTWKGSGSFSILDKSDNTSLSASFSITANTANDTVNLTLSNLKYILSDYTITTAKYSDILSNAEFEALPQITPEDGIALNNIQGNAFSLMDIFSGTSDTITITSASGISIDAGAGNDKVTGGTGNDTITAGAGGDSLTGGKGNDTFILKKSDYDFTSAKTVLADTITDFKYTSSEKDTLTLDGFGDVDAYKTLALAKKAGSTANVIYESGTGKFWYNEDGDSALVGAMAFATVKGLSNDYLVQAGWLSL
jgi:Ca2+-binding RTX toxin-like protein